MKATLIVPMTAGEIIARAFRLYASHLATLVLIAFLPQAALLLLDVLVTAGSGGRPAPAALVLVLVATVAANAVALAAITSAVAAAAAERTPSVTLAYRMAFREKLGSVLLGYLVTALLVSLGFMVLIVPGILLGGLFAPLVPVIVLERRDAFPALARCITLMKEHWLKGMAVFAFVVLISGVVPLAFHFVVGFGPFTPLLGAIVGSVLLPLAYTANVLLYFAVRAPEGYTPAQLESDLSRYLSP